MTRFQEVMDKALVSKSRVRAQGKYSKYMYMDNEVNILESYVKRHICRTVAEEFNSNTPFTIDKVEDGEYITYSTDVIIMDTKLFKETVEAYIRLLPKTKLVEILK